MVKEYSSRESDAEELETGSDIKHKILDMKNKYNDYAIMYEEQFIYNLDEVGIRHPKSKSYIKLYNSGDIQLFTGSRTGMIVSDEHQSFNIYGEATNINAPVVRLNTNPNGLTWNDWTVNPILYQISDKLNPKYWTGTWNSKNLSGPTYRDDLKLFGDYRWWCPGIPSLCGDPEPHGGHWVRRSIKITPFFRAWEDVEYRDMLDKFDIPR